MLLHPRRNVDCFPDFARGFGVPKAQPQKGHAVPRERDEHDQHGER